MQSQHYFQPLKNNREHEPGHNHSGHLDHDETYERAMATPRRALAEGELRQWYAALPDAVLRVHGWVLLSDHGGLPALVQSIDQRLEITPTKPGAFPEDALLVICGLPGCLHGVTAPDGSPLARTM